MASLAMSIAKNEFIVGGKYRLMRKIGSGSFGDIYLGINISNGEVWNERKKESFAVAGTDGCCCYQLDCFFRISPCVSSSTRDRWTLLLTWQRRRRRCHERRGLLERSRDRFAAAPIGREDLSLSEERRIFPRRRGRRAPVVKRALDDAS